ncbi:hypothetical protein [Mesorhizobium muleiense]|uniref:hypothetical protein n=1 Tax=Mesorhizobium muleiense TaxID=1004279 RepID=UPI001ABF684B|nr:hypothetical protein [Mesorhizobium muleiense]MCF6103003.1 hypothetical protein [Mesorhizobium muleiense]
MGNLIRPSKTKAFISHIVAEVASSTGAASTVFDIEVLGRSFPLARYATSANPSPSAGARLPC